MRRLVSIFFLALFVGPPLTAWAQADVPVVDIVEVAGVIDRPVERYLLERIEEAEREKAALLVLQVDSLGGVKVRHRNGTPLLVERIRDATVPIAVHVGPRGARAAGLLVPMAMAADVASIGPSGRIGPLHPFDLGAPGRYEPAAEREMVVRLAAEHDRQVRAGTLGDPRSFSANQALEAGLVDLVVQSVAEMLQRADGRIVTAGGTSVTLHLPSDGVDVRFHQPGPIRRLLHTFANPALLYVMIVAGALMIVFELFQPGFGVAGITGGLLWLAAGYGLTVLPARWYGIALLAAGLLLLTLDVALDRLGIATATGAAGLLAGSFLLLPNDAEPVRLSFWLIVLGAVSSLIVFVPVMTVVRRARHPIATQAKKLLVGEDGEVRSMLNPEGFVWVDGELWRARSEDGRRVRVGEDVVVTAVEGTVLIVRSPQTPPSPNGSSASSR